MILRVICILSIISILCTGCNNSESGGDSDGKRPKVAYVTNGVASFWVIAESGVKKGGEEFNADVEVLMPAEGISDQKRMIEDALIKGFDGIAISPIDPENQTDLINKATDRTNVITHDSDAPDSKRLCYIGMDNYQAGLMCGKLARKSIPSGKVALFIGRLEQDNSKRRRQGTIDGLLGREPDPTRFDPPDQEIKEAGYHIVGTYTDQFDRAQGKANAEDVLSRHPDIAGMVGLFAYNPPLILEALKVGEKLDQVKVIGFDEADATLQGIIDGTVAGTVVQNPFEYGRQSVRILAGLANGETLTELGVPESNFIDIPARTIEKDNVQEFWDELKKNLGK
jgi:ribose transport system substrate-binding protein